MIDIVLVSYLNTIPFLEGLNNNNAKNQFRVTRKTPADCAAYFMDGKADIALLPVGMLPVLQSHKIISDYCIGCKGAVRTVVIMSNSEINDLHTIYLDSHSRSSSVLTRIVFNDFRKMKINFIYGLPENFGTLKNGEGALLIGDKVFEKERKFKHKLDLGEEWLKFTGLPFTFAVWVARDYVLDADCQKLNDYLAKGVESLNTKTYDDFEGIDLEEYFHKFISYDFDLDKRKAVEQYLKLGMKYIIKT